MTKRRKHTKKSALKKKTRRMRQHAREHSAESRERARIKHDYAPYKVGESCEEWGLE